MCYQPSLARQLLKLRLKSLGLWIAIMHDAVASGYACPVCGGFRVTSEFVSCVHSFGVITIFHSTVSNDPKSFSLRDQSPHCLTVSLPQSLCLSVSLSHCLCLCLTVSLCLCLAVFLSLCLSHCLSDSLCLSHCLSVPLCLTIFLSLHISGFA